MRRCIKQLCAVLMIIGLNQSIVSCGKDEPSSDFYSPADHTGNSSGIKINNNGHEYVDLGLKVLWATRNIGALNITSMGDLYAFGETNTKDDYAEENYIGGEKDVVKEKWGGAWRLPTSLELDELVKKCSFNLKTIDGTDVIEVIGPNGNSMVMPYSIYLWEGEGLVGFYWSGTSDSSERAAVFYFSKENQKVYWGTLPKYYGCLVRGVMNNPNYSSSGGSSGGNSSGTGSGGSGNSGSGSNGNENGGDSGGSGSSNDHHYPCKSCGESGDCWNCFGTGKDPITQKRCNTCRGSGKCQTCRGKGYIIV